MKKDVISPNFARFNAAMMLSRRIPNADFDNQPQRRAAVHAWAAALKAALKERG